MNEDRRYQGQTVEAELAAARGALEPHELTDALVRASKRITPDARLVWLFDNVDQAERRTAKAIPGFPTLHWVVSQGPAFDLGGRLLLVTTETRESEDPLRAAEPGYHRVAIERLAANNVKQLVSSLTGVHPEADAFAAAIAEETKGNVHHTIELLRVLVGEGAVVPLGPKCAIGWEQLHLGMALAAMSRNDDAAAKRELVHARKLIPKDGTSYLEGALSWHVGHRIDDEDPAAGAK